MTAVTPFHEFANLCESLESTTKRNTKVELIVSFLRKLKEDEVSPAVHFIVGRAFPEADERVLEVSGQTLWRMRRTTKQVTLTSEPLTIRRVEEYFIKIAATSGVGSRKMKLALLDSLLSQANPLESEYLVRIMLGEMRIGVVEGVMLDAIAEASKADRDLVRRAYMLLGNLGDLALIALRKGPDGLREVGVQLFKPIKPMLAEMSYDIGEVLSEHGGATAFEFKYDGARIQIHKRADEVKIFSRRLTDVTESLPDIVDLAKRRLRAHEALLEGEVVATGEGDRPLPFQDLMRRFRRVHEVPEKAEEIPLKLYFFDIVYLDGRTLTEEPYDKRWKLLSEICEEDLLANRIVTGERRDVDDFLKRAIDAGHEGLMAKDLKSTYTPGVRGKRWFKIKPAEHIDTVIVAADWGSGRRRGWLSNYHLAVRDEETGEFLVVGKTFKGLTDEEFADMTRRLKELKTTEGEYTVKVKPSIVVEVAYNEIQRSPHYKSGFALRFARITRIRTDKSPSDADTLERLRELYQHQFRYKAKSTL